MNRASREHYKIKINNMSKLCTLCFKISRFLEKSLTICFTYQYIDTKVILLIYRLSLFSRNIRYLDLLYFRIYTVENIYNMDLTNCNYIVSLKKGNTVRESLNRYQTVVNEVMMKRQSGQEGQIKSINSPPYASWLQPTIMLFPREANNL